MSLLYDALGNHVFWEPRELVDRLNDASMLVTLLKPELLHKRVVIARLADECFIHLQSHASDLLTVQGLVIGDVTTETPVRSGGMIRHLRRESFLGFLARPDVLRRRAGIPTAYAPFGKTWLITYPRAAQALDFTLMYRAKPVVLSHTRPNEALNLPEPYQQIVVDVAVALALAKKGLGDSQDAMTILSRVFGREAIEPMAKAMGRAEHLSRAA